MHITAHEQARLDYINENHSHNIALTLSPEEELFDIQEFFKQYEDPIVDRERERMLYIMKRDGKRIVKRRPKRTL